jgi:hypothetical protein
MDTKAPSRKNRTDPAAMMPSRFGVMYFIKISCYGEIRILLKPS